VALAALSPAGAEASEGTFGTPFASEEAVASETGSPTAYLESTYHLSTAEAQRRVNLQDRTQNLPTAMTSAAGSRYAGIWFDNSDGRLKVDLAKGANTAAVNAALSEQNLSSETDVVTVSNTWDELVAEQASLDKEFHILEENRDMRTGINPSTNSVDVAVPEGLPTSENEALEAASKNSSVKVGVQRLPASHFVAQTAQSACGTEYSHTFEAYVIDCARPLRAGVLIEGSQNGCTAGFYAFDNVTGHVVMITAGHCIDPGGYWYADYWGGVLTEKPVREEIGPQEKPYWGVLGDSMEIDAASNGCPSSINWWCYYGWPPQYMSTITNIYEEPVNSVNVSQPGYALCETGAFGASKCGTVQHTHVTINDGHEVQNLSEINICLHHGDSGGPVYSETVAYGINNASTINAPCEAWYTEALNAENLENAKIP
jgi:streptogrisin D